MYDQIAIIYVVTPLIFALLQSSLHYVCHIVPLYILL